MTLDYASPEQVSGGTVTTVSDVYSLGVVLYRLLTGQSPYGARVQRRAAAGGDPQRHRADPPEPGAHRRSRACARHRRRSRQHPAHGAAQGTAAPLRQRRAVRQRPAQLPGGPARCRRVATRCVTGGQVPAPAQGGDRRRGGGCRCRWSVASFAIREARVAEQQRVVAQRHFDSVRKLANTCCSIFTTRSRHWPVPPRRARCW